MLLIALALLAAAGIVLGVVGVILFRRSKRSAGTTEGVVGPAEGSEGSGANP